MQIKLAKNTAGDGSMKQMNCEKLT